MFFFVASLKIIKKLISKILRTLQSFFSYNFLFKFSCNFERSDPQEKDDYEYKKMKIQAFILEKSSNIYEFN